MRVNSGLLAAAVLCTVLAGCVGGAPDSVVEPTRSAQPGQESGSLSGLVLTQDDLPIRSAEVAIVEIDDTQLTDASGAFVFNNLTAGSYRLLVQKLGFEAHAQMVQITVGQTTEVTVRLDPVVISQDPYVVPLIFDGFIQCGVNPIWPTNACGDTLGTDTARFYFTIDANVTLGELVVEVVWTPTTAATGQHLELDICDEVPAEDDQLLCLEGDYWEFTSGPSPLVMRLDDVPVDKHTRYQVTVGAGFPDESQPESLGPAVQQSFEIFISQCYVEACGDEYTATAAA